MTGDAVPGGGRERGGGPPDGGGGARRGARGRGETRGGGGPRAAILARVRAALETREPVEHPGALSFPDPPEGPVEAFAARFRAAGGEVVTVAGEEEARAWLERFGGGFGSAAAGHDLPEPLRPVLPDVPPAEADLGVSMARWAAADTGSLLLDSREGRRGQLLPPTHLVWVRRRRIVPTLAEALERVSAERLPSVLALHSGPSKSADIGGILVTGIHGPGRVVAAVVGRERP